MKPELPSHLERELMYFKRNCFKGFFRRRINPEGVRDYYWLVLSLANKYECHAHLFIAEDYMRRLIEK